MRIDVYLTKNNLAGSRAKAQGLIEEGLVFVNGKTVTKSSFEVEDCDRVEVEAHKEYVSRGSLKLLGGIEAFGLDFNQKVVLDMGSSTGGFTQVALEHGAKKVYAVDVGKNQLDKSLKCDKRVVSIEETDIRVLSSKDVGDSDMVIGDLSFISLFKVLPHIKEILGAREMCLLFKPQFECGKGVAQKCRGVVKDEKLHIKLLKEFVENIKLLGFIVSGLAPSPIKGGDGNREYLVHLNGGDENFNIERVVKENFDK